MPKDSERSGFGRNFGSRLARGSCAAQRKDRGKQRRINVSLSYFLLLGARCIFRAQEWSFCLIKKRKRWFQKYFLCSPFYLPFLHIIKFGIGFFKALLETLAVHEGIPCLF
jgi:hypothetical protein